MKTDNDGGTRVRLVYLRKQFTEWHCLVTQLTTIFSKRVLDCIVINQRSGRGEDGMNDRPGSLIEVGARQMTSRVFTARASLRQIVHRIDNGADS